MSIKSVCLNCGKPKANSEICSCGSQNFSVAKSKEVTGWHEITTRSAAAAFINFQLDNWVWTSHVLNGNIEIKGLDDFIIKMKGIAADDPYTYEMSFLLLYHCVTKSTNEILDLLQKMDIANGKKLSEAVSLFNTLKASIAKILSSKKTIIEKLTVDYDFAVKQKLFSTKIKELSKKLSEIDSVFESLRQIPLEFEMLPKIAEYQNMVNSKKYEEYLVKGIDAKNIYNEAINKFNDQQFNDALQLFSKIKDYSKAEEIIAYITKNVTVNNFEFYAGDINYIKENKTKRNIVNGLFANNYCDGLFNFTMRWGDIVLNTGSNGFEILNKKKITDNYTINKIAFFNLLATKSRPGNQVFTILADKGYSFYGDGIVYDKTLLNNTSFIFGVKIPKYAGYDKKKIRPIFVGNRTKFIEQYSKVTIEEPVYKDNICDLWLYNIENDSFTLIDQNIQWHDKDGKLLLNYLEDNLFYCKPVIAQTIVEKKQEITYVINNFSICTYKKNGFIQKDIFITNGTSKIVNIMDDGTCIILYSKGKDNYSIILKKENQNSELIEENIFEYHAYHLGRIFYTVGNDKEKTLYIYDTVTKERQELEKEMRSERFGTLIGDWRYLSWGSETTKFGLIRKPINGGETEVVIERFDFYANMDATIIGVQSYCDAIKHQEYYNLSKALFAGKLWYLLDGRLYCVNMDGSNPTEIASINTVMGVVADRVYYTVSEQNSLSVYSMKIDGTDRKKNLSNIKDAMIIFGNKILFSDIKNVDLATIYSNITHPKVKKSVNKTVAKYSKKGIQLMRNYNGLHLYDILNGSEKTICYNIDFPTLLELKELRKGKKVKEIYNNYKQSLRNN